MLKNSFLLLTVNAFAAIASFVRNIIIARVISVEDFGIAMLFALTMSAIEMASNLAIDKMIIQDEDGDSECFQSSGQAFQLARGLISGLILFFSANYVAEFFKVPIATWTFQLLALYPVIKGFTHLDVARFQRKMNFLPLMWVDAIPNIVCLALTWPLTIWLKDYSVMVWLLLIQVSLYVLLTHMFAVRKFILQYDYNILKKMYAFGWPLLVNGVLMFAILQGDKAIVGSMYSMETLGWYSAAFSLTLAPAMLLMKVNQTILLPILSRCKSEIGVFKRRSILTLQSYVLIGTLLGFFFILFGSDLLMLFFGEKYSAAIEVVAWLGLMQGIRVIKAGPIIVALAGADTKNPMISNSVRGLAFVVAVCAAWLGCEIKLLVIIALLGEVAAFILSVLMLSKSLHLALWKCVYVALVSLLVGVFLIYILPSFTENQPLLMLIKLMILITPICLSGPLITSIRRGMFQGHSNKV